MTIYELYDKVIAGTEKDIDLSKVTPLSTAERAMLINGLKVNFKRFNELLDGLKRG